MTLCQPGSQNVLGHRKLLQQTPTGPPSTAAIATAIAQAIASGNTSAAATAIAQAAAQVRCQPCVRLCIRVSEHRAWPHQALLISTYPACINPLFIPGPTEARQIHCRRRFPPGAHGVINQLNATLDTIAAMNLLRSCRETPAHSHPPSHWQALPATLRPSRRQSLRQ